MAVALIATCLFSSCVEEPIIAEDVVDKSTLSEEYYAGGLNGTVFNETSRCFEQPSPAISNHGAFLNGESFFENRFVTGSDSPFSGLGPVYIKTSCVSCHPGYGRGKRTDRLSTDHANGYIAFVHNPDGSIVEGFTVMLQIHAVDPYVAPAEDVIIHWNEFVDEYGNKYPDGTPYNQGKITEGSLSYPTAELIGCIMDVPEDYQVSVEATIGIYGTGLLDAIRDEDIIAEYNRQQEMDGPIKGQHGRWITEAYDGKQHLGKFTWHCSRATLENGPGFNGIYSISNITRADKPSLYATKQWIEKQHELGIDTTGLHATQPIEMHAGDLSDFMLWHRGLAVPAARNLDDEVVQQGKNLFYEAKCAECHKPTWTTGEYAHIPGYSNQKIRPYTDLLMHDMGDENKGRFRTYRTPPLWGKGLMEKAANHTDMFHDLRARDFEEAILWHFGEAEEAREFFRNLTKENREALIKFCQSI
ncbi:di-heme oxidoredictase family protein [uncultured Draconibacterium sp.]|uniref:di-heme oxidoredictase family protein n=1 Tax=uncultured Draconibacterium sp. TaxID=1573823 RepID=UPI002AA6FAB9|nr:di-heme oxidoredictase family protein [uncultured Draconibacterium sp.]